MTATNPRAAWTLILAASAILMITMAARLTTGLFPSPLNTATGLGVASIGFATAVGQFMWGASQPVFGAVADKFGSARVIVPGAVLLAATTLFTIPLAWPLRGRPPAQTASGHGAVPAITLGRQVREALRDRSYLCLHAGFFTCGFHIAFLVTHLPFEVASCGLPAGVSATALGLIGLLSAPGAPAATAEA